MIDDVKLSVVTTLFRSSGTIGEFVERAAKEARSLVGAAYEIVIVNDGSPDDSLERVRELQDQMPELVIVDLSRNFGHHVALLEGLRQSRGDLIFLIDSDLEEDPTWLPNFYDEMARAESSVVYGYQEKRKGEAFERITGKAYWWLFRRLSGLDIPANVVTCRLMTRQYADAVMRYEEREVSIGAIFNVVGFKQIGIPVSKGNKGKSSYSLRLKIWHLVNSIVSFSTKPLSAIFVTGVVVSAVGLILCIYLLVAGVLWSQSPAGWRSVVASLWLLGGLCLASLGVIAIYLGKIFSEVKGRPRVIVRSIERRPPRT